MKRELKLRSNGDERNFLSPMRLIDGDDSKRAARLWASFVTALVLAFTLISVGCGGGGSTQIAVIPNPAAAQTIDQGQTVNFTVFVAVNNATSTTGVNWTLGPLTGTTCTGSACGTLTNVMPTSVTYAAPASVTKALQVTLTATSTVNSHGVATVNITVEPAPKILTTSLPGGTNGENYSEPVEVNGGVAPLLYSISQGSLPQGLHINTNGTIFGRPSGAAGTSTFTVQITDQGSPPVAVSQQYSIPIQSPPPLSVSTNSLPNASQGSPYGFPLAASGGVAPITWSIASGALPPGLSLDPTSGQISGIPTSQGTFKFSPQATDSAIPPQLASVGLPLSLLVGVPLPLSVATTQLPEGLSGTPYSSTLHANGGVGPFNWVLTGGTLPSGLSLDSSTGVISGLPTAVSSASFSVQVTDSETPAQHAPANLSLAIGSSTNNSLLLNGNYVFVFEGFNSKGAYIMGGNMTADGKGNILGGNVDINSTAGPNPQASLFGNYAVGSDGRGNIGITVTCATTVASCVCLPTSFSCTTTSISNKFTYQFALDGNGNAQFMEQDGSGIRGTGILKKQTVTIFGPQNFLGNYAFGFAGVDNSAKRLALAGVIHADGSSLLQNGNADINDAGTLTTTLPDSITGTFLVAPNGRGTATVTSLTSATLNYAFYMVSSSDVLFAGLDPVSATNPMTSGEAILQSQPSFDATALNGTGVATETGLDASGKSSVLAGLLTGNGTGNTGNVSSTTDTNDGGTVVSNAVGSGSYTASSNGRVVFSGLGTQLGILYLTGPNQGILLGQDPAASLGSLEAQSGGPVLSASSITGYFDFGLPAAIYPGTAETSVSDFVGSFNSDGVGAWLGKIDKVNPNNSSLSNLTLKAKFTVVSANGRGTLTISSPSALPAQFVFYIVSPTQIRIISSTTQDSHPEVFFSND